MKTIDPHNVIDTYYKDINTNQIHHLGLTYNKVYLDGELIGVPVKIDLPIAQIKQETRVKCACGKLATWRYIPGSGVCCDDCVPRGCTCNEYEVNNMLTCGLFVDLPANEMVKGVDWEWVEKNKRWRDLDNGKQIPCHEWWYYKDGWAAD